MYLETEVDEKKIKIYNEQYKIVTETPTSKKEIHNLYLLKLFIKQLCTLYNDIIHIYIFQLLFQS